MRKPVIITTAALSTVLGVVWAGVAIADQDRTPAKPEPAPAVSIEQAVRSALGTVPGGRAESADLDDDDRRVWEVEVVTPDGKEHEVHVDATTGKAQAAPADDTDDDRDDDGDDD
jgi:uncharacterized membrane protein YkoI